MVLSDRFLGIAAQALQQRVNEKLLAELTRIFPESYDSLQMPNALIKVDDARKAGVKLGIVTEKGAFCRIAIAALLGEDFYAQADWQAYMAASAGIGDYALDAFLNTVNGLFGMATEDKNGWALTTGAYELLPGLASAAAAIITAQNSLDQLVGLEISRQIFLNRVPAVIVKKAYNPQIAELNRTIRKTDAAIQQLQLPLQQLKNRMIALELEIIRLGEFTDPEVAAGADGADDENVRLLETTREQFIALQASFAEAEEKSSRELGQLTSRSRSLRHEAELKRNQR